MIMRWTPKLWLLFLLIEMAFGKKTSGSCQPLPSCHECIRSHPSCAWCKQLDFLPGDESDAGRCATRLELEHRGCLPSEIMDPHGKQHILEDRPLSEKPLPESITQLAPQRISLQLRPGEEQSFTVRFRRAEGYPVDLYYLMDLSHSMKDDLENIKRLGSDLLAALRNISTSVKIGFGSFVDKTVLPYVSTSPAKWLHPCPIINEPCQSAFSFRHVLALTDNASEFEGRVSQQFISGNLDTAEGGFDAVMQVAACKEQIGWRDVTKLLVFTSDGTFHTAGDGKLGGVYLPNDGHCHLDENGLYADSHLYDYPSVGHLAEVLSKSNIQPIFAVTRPRLLMYEELSKLIPKSAVGELTEDSSNVVQLITDAYNSLSSTVNLEHSSDLPPGISIAYDSHCGDSETFGRTQGGECSGVHINQLVQFTVRINATTCLPGTQDLVLRVLGVGEEVRVQLSTVCECQCGDVQPYAPHCSGGQGNLTCGVCSCREGHRGRLCECQQEARDEPEAGCHDGNSTGPVCSGKGQCVCGRCQCHAHASGPLCKCDDTGCERRNGELCAGHGQCRCGVCECQSNYTGGACDCSLDTSGCLREGAVCSGHGRCVCNRCHCEAGWLGSHCSHCTECRTPCEQHRDCAECKAFGTGSLSGNCSVSCNQTTRVTSAPAVDEKWCKMTAEDGSLLIYLVERDETGGTTLTVNSREEISSAVDTSQESLPWPCQTQLALPSDEKWPLQAHLGATDQTLKLVLGSVLGPMALGLLLMVLYCVVVQIWDRREVKSFEEECKRAKGNEVNNPLFKQATTTVVNPKYSKED